MQLKVEKGRILQLIEAFYAFAGIKIAIYDEKFREILAYPEKNSDFCAFISEKEEAQAKCMSCTAEICRKCKETKETIIYKCHAGLTEAVTLLQINGVVIGYVVCGQIVGEADEKKLWEDVKARCKQYGLDEEQLCAHLKKVKYYSEKQINYALEIIKALIVYAVQEGMVFIGEEALGIQLMEYINQNISGDLTIKALCRKFATSKANLYNAAKLYMPEGIGKYIRTRRMESAKENIMRNPEKPLWQVAEEAGFEDYTYFLRVFKSKNGKSAGSFRKKE